jgi:MoxR-like ATPase
VADNVIEYAVNLVSATRPGENAQDFINEWVDWGAGPRASQFLILGAKAKAILDGRPTADIDDVKSLSLPVLRHRVLPNFNAEAEGVSVDDIISKLINLSK